MDIGWNKRLRIYLILNDKNIDKFAKELGCTRTHLGEVISGRRKPSQILAKSIEVATNKEIKADEILSQYKEKDKEE